MAIEFSVNGRSVSASSQKGDMPLLWFLREDLGLKGTKFGCGIGQCGACTVHLNGVAIRSCSVTLASLRSSSVITIEGLAGDEGTLHPVQRAWQKHDVPQCGYCQAGQIMSAAAFLQNASGQSLDDAEIDRAMTNICRCGTYTRIRAAVREAGKHFG